MIELAIIDGVLHPHEAMFIQSLALRMGINTIVFQRIVERPENTPLRIPTSEKERFQQVCELIILAPIDQNRDDKELEFIKQHAIKMGIPNYKVNKLFDYLKTNTIPKYLSSLNALFDLN
ncbi:hypothetical protein G3O08_15930 [Cryomorpha ignava]|uniref:TerB family tellurite resistance protein n=1 Tax=Cryomorpha ignava TaxID=101383 RepID=A0A7K3WTI9_9FLAO|nr:hypothetical protein [Cryomorpha ignava]NEN24990.1 hypothetical protein [Cryomorpha ignava]